jgi:hypothetical protein
MKPKRRKGRPLLVAGLGLVILTYMGCEQEVGNPGPADLSMKYPDIGNPKQPPDIAVDPIDMGDKD